MVLCNSSQTLRRLLVLGTHVQKIKACRLSTTSPCIELSTKKALMDEKIRITVRGLQEGQRITLQTSLKESERVYGACGHYVADQEGKVDTFEHLSHGGTFEGADPMGLFWSMKTAPGVKPGRLNKADVMSPFNVTVAVEDSFRQFDELTWSGGASSLAQCDLQRTYAGPGVRRIPVHVNGIYGTLFVPPGEGPFPAVISISGLAAGITEFRSALLASHGFASFCIAYIAHEDLPKQPSQLDFNYFLRAFDWLASHPLVDAESLGGMSTCVGGGILQLIASLRPAMKCIASLNSTGIPPGPEQTVEGLHVKPLQIRLERLRFKEGKASLRQMFLPEDDVTVVPGWQHGAKLLSIQGLDDQCINPSFLNLFRSKIPHEFEKNCTFITYPGAGHFIEPPYSPHTRANYNPIFKVYLLWGGEPYLHAQAQESSWAKIISFLDENLRSPLRNRAAQLKCNQDNTTTNDAFGVLREGQKI